jgi:dolichyl-diphosphooligosaccharide---protein glycosyltransferase
MAAGSANGASKGKEGKHAKQQQGSAAASKTAGSSALKGAGGGTGLDIVLHSVAVVLLLQALYKCCQEAKTIRLYAIEEYGRVIHEFDPYFNYRATEYLWANGWHAFSHWFDYKVWYPLGRPVGTTIYPGMQVTAVAIKMYLLPNWSVNDICCFVPVWFGVAATLAVAWLTYNCVTRAEKQYVCAIKDVPVVSAIYDKVVKPLVKALLDALVKLTGSDWGLQESHPLTPLCCAVASAAIMSIVPAHLLRSVGGGYDNESVAVTAMVLTYCCWTKSLQNYGQSDRHGNGNNALHWNVIWGLATGLAYFNMVAAWGGYVFVLNLLGVHAAFLVLIGRYSRKLHLAYSTFYALGTFLAIRVPVVGWTPLKSLEQLGPAAVFGGLQVIMVSDYLIARRKTTRVLERWKIRVTVGLVALSFLTVAVLVLAPTGYFGPISSRVRGLFVEHTKTGNPLVDSVAEHQPASTQAYFQYLNNVVYLAPVGLAIVMLFGWSDASSFLFVYAVAAYFFSHRMVRLILLTAPIASVCGGICLGHVASWILGAVTTYRLNIWEELLGTRPATAPPTGGGTSTSRAYTADPIWVRAIRLAVSAYILKEAIPQAKSFKDLAHDMAHHISHPSIIQKGRTNEGQMVTVDDYREAYWWLRDNTDEDARVVRLEN